MNNLENTNFLQQEEPALTLYNVTVISPEGEALKTRSLTTNWPMESDEEVIFHLFPYCKLWEGFHLLFESNLSEECRYYTVYNQRLHHAITLYRSEPIEDIFNIDIDE